MASRWCPYTMPGDWSASSTTMVTGSIVISLDYFKRVIAGLRGLVGGRIKTYEPLLERARREAMDAGLEHVYIGNLFGHEAESTICPRDATVLIRRTGFWIHEYNLTADGRCPVCLEVIPGVWHEETTE